MLAGRCRWSGVVLGAGAAWGGEQVSREGNSQAPSRLKSGLRLGWQQHLYSGLNRDRVTRG